MPFFPEVPFNRANQVSVPGNPDSMIAMLQKQLKPFGYSAYASRSYQRMEVFQTQKEAEDFANGLQIPQWQVRISKTPEFGFSVPPELQEIYPGLLKPPDSKTEKINGKIRTTVASKFSVDAELLTAVLSKEERIGEADKFLIVRSQVLEANEASVTLTFDRLPNDLSKLCTEIWLFCPSVVDSDPDYCKNAARLRNFAGNLRSTKKVTLFWD